MVTFSFLQIILIFITKLQLIFHIPKRLKRLNVQCGPFIYIQLTLCFPTPVSRLKKQVHFFKNNKIKLYYLNYTLVNA